MVFIYESFWFIIKDSMPSTESPILNHCDTIWDIYVSEGFATTKSPILNRCDTIWDIYVSEGFATAKCPHSNRCDTIWDIYAGERIATHKSPISNCCDTIWNIYAGKGFASTKSWCKDYSFLKWEPLHHERSVYECTFRFDMHYKKTKRVSSQFDGIRLFCLYPYRLSFFLGQRISYWKST